MKEILFDILSLSGLNSEQRKTIISLLVNVVKTFPDFYYQLLL